MSALTDHPRVGGEHIPNWTPNKMKHGSSPRGRGTLMAETIEPNDDRIIPAWAGNTPAYFPVVQLTADHPRVGGEHFYLGAGEVVVIGSSPRGRGTRRP